MKKRNRRSFSPEFKLEAVRLLVEGGRPLSQVCKYTQVPAGHEQATSRTTWGRSGGRRGRGGPPGWG